MKNRNLSSPILCAIVLSLVTQPVLFSRAETDNSIPTSPAPEAPPTPTVSTNVAAKTTAATHTLSYTVMAGDSLTSIAQKFNTTRKKLRALNDLTASTVKPGQILQIPSTKSPRASTTALATQAKVHHKYPMAQPVQDFDIPASTFGSCPVPIPSPDEDADSAAPDGTGKPAPIAKLVSPAELAADESAPGNVAPVAPAPKVADTVAVAPPSVPTRHAAATAPAYPNAMASSPHVFNAPVARPASRALSQSRFANPPGTRPENDNDWGTRFLQEARALGNQGIEYDEDWRPPGESHSWAMDCSNTSRYIYKVTTGIQLPRTASDQYYYLHLQGKAWDVPQASDGWADGDFLRRNLKPGDLLFWENTYRPERQPPITHVMVFLGTNERGQWIMAGSQTSRGGEHNRRNGGPDVYVFRPSQPCGGYTTWLGMVHHQGRFCAFGRPLEADPAKLAVAAND